MLMTLLIAAITVVIMVMVFISFNVIIVTITLLLRLSSTIVSLLLPFITLAWCGHSDWSVFR